MKFVAILFLFLPLLQAEKMRQGDPYTLCKFWQAQADPAFLKTYCPALTNELLKQWHKLSSRKYQVGFVVGTPNKEGIIDVTIANGSEDQTQKLKLPAANFSGLSKVQINLCAKKHARELLSSVTNIIYD